MTAPTDTDHTTPHLIRCYANVQEVIRFMDTKAAVVFTLAGVLLGAMAFKPEEWQCWARILLIVAAFLTVGSMLFALRVVWPGHGPKKPEQLTLLFPALHPDARDTKGLKPDIMALVKQKTSSPFGLQLVMDEYATQLGHLHASLVRKIRALRWAILLIGAALFVVAVCQAGRQTAPDSEKAVTIKNPVTVSIAKPLQVQATTSVTLDDKAPLEVNVNRLPFAAPLYTAKTTQPLSKPDPSSQPSLK